MVWLRSFFVIVCFIGFAPAALACTCISSFEDTTESADVIFVGIAKETTIEEGTHGAMDKKITEFEVFKIFKGWVPQRVNISTDTDTCGRHFKLHKLQMVVARGRSYRSLFTDHCFGYGSYADYVNYFENPLSQFEETLSKLVENGEWQTCFFKLKEAYEREIVDDSLNVHDPVCEKYDRFYKEHFHMPQPEDYGLTARTENP